MKHRRFGRASVSVSSLYYSNSSCCFAAALVTVAWGRKATARRLEKMLTLQSVVRRCPRVCRSGRVLWVELYSPLPKRGILALLSSECDLPWK